MAAPTTRSGLATYMEGVVGPTGEILGLTVYDYTAPVDSVLLALDVDEPADATNTRLLLALAHYEAWALVAARTVPYHDIVGPTGETIDQSQIHAHALGMMERSQRRIDALTSTSESFVRRYTIVRTNDPYRRETR